MTDKIQLIKMYREKYSCGLVEAKNAIENFIAREIEYFLSRKHGKQYQEWEYKVEFMGAHVGINFKALGAEGWELCGIRNTDYYFKRKK